MQKNIAYDGRRIQKFLKKGKLTLISITLKAWLKESLLGFGFQTDQHEITDWVSLETQMNSYPQQLHQDFETKYQEEELFF